MGRTSAKVLLVAVALSSVALAGCTDSNFGIVDGLNSGLGSILNVAPDITAFNSSIGSIDNSGADTEVFFGTVYDANYESDLASLSISIVPLGGLPQVSTRLLTSADFARTIEPAPDGNGWAVWTGTANDGVLNFRYTWDPSAGTLLGIATATLTATDTLLLTDVAVTTTLVTLFDEVTVGALPVGPNGAALGTAWGLWTANPGATDQTSTNYLVLTNTGQNANAEVIVDFAAAFTGVTNASQQIPIDNNMQFRVAKVSAGIAPQNATFSSWSATSATGSYTVQFDSLLQVAFVQYRIVTLPSPLSAQDYQASFTVTQV